MMLLFFQARVWRWWIRSGSVLAPLAEAILHSPEGKIIVDRHYYAFSSIISTLIVRRCC